MVANLPSGEKKNTESSDAVLTVSCNEIYHKSTANLVKNMKFGRNVRLHVTCVLMTLTFGLLLPSAAVSHTSPDLSGSEWDNASRTSGTSGAPSDRRSTGRELMSVGGNLSHVPPAELSHPVSTSSPAPHPAHHEFPTALVVASSIAAVCILVFFIASYVWHTRQLDSRARKLAVRLAADAERGAHRRACTPRSHVTYSRAASCHQLDNHHGNQDRHLAIFSTDAEPGGGRGEAAWDAGGGWGETFNSGRWTASDSEVADTSDTAEPPLPPLPSLPPLLSDRGRSSLRGGRGAHRKWGRSRKSTGGMDMDKLDSAVTDKEILSHFASRRHSTFFI